LEFELIVRDMIYGVDFDVSDIVRNVALSTKISTCAIAMPRFSGTAK